MRKVKFTQQNYHDRLSQILTDFPKLDVSDSEERKWLFKYEPSDNWCLISLVYSSDT